MFWKTIWDSETTVQSVAKISSIRDRLYCNVQKGDECWIWKGTVVRDRGKIIIEGRQLYVHRVSWELANGESIPEGMRVVQSCRNLVCVKPEHLSLKKHGDLINMIVIEDKWPKAKLTAAKVVQIRERLKSRTQRQIAKEEGLNVATIGRIKRRESWKEI